MGAFELVFPIEKLVCAYSPTKHWFHTSFVLYIVVDNWVRGDSTRAWNTMVLHKTVLRTLLQKINLPTNGARYNRSETTARIGPKFRINVHFVHLNRSVIWRIIKNKSPESENRKMSKPPLNASFWDISNGGLGSLLALSVGWQIDFLCYCTRQAIKL